MQCLASPKLYHLKEATLTPQAIQESLIIKAVSLHQCTMQHKQHVSKAHVFASFCWLLLCKAFKRTLWWQVFQGFISLLPPHPLSSPHTLPISLPHSPPPSSPQREWWSEWWTWGHHDRLRAHQWRHWHPSSLLWGWRWSLSWHTVHSRHPPCSPHHAATPEERRGSRGRGAVLRFQDTKINWYNYVLSSN